MKISLLLYAVFELHIKYFITSQLYTFVLFPMKVSVVRYTLSGSLNMNNFPICIVFYISLLMKLIKDLHVLSLFDTADFIVE